MLYISKKKEDTTFFFLDNQFIVNLINPYIKLINNLLFLLLFFFLPTKFSQDREMLLVKFVHCSYCIKIY